MAAGDVHLSRSMHSKKTLLGHNAVGGGTRKVVNRTRAPKLPSISIFHPTTEKATHALLAACELVHTAPGAFEQKFYAAASA